MYETARNRSQEVRLLRQWAVREGAIVEMRILAPMRIRFWWKQDLNRLFTALDVSELDDVEHPSQLET